MSSSPITINIIGAGRWGPNLIRTFDAHPGSRIGCICDLEAGRLARLASRYPGAVLSRDPAAAATDPAADAIVIVTPVATHFELAHLALSAGKDVFVEKPLAASSREAAALAVLAAERGRILMVGHIFKYNAAVRATKDLLDRGALGPLVSLHARRTNLGPVRADVNALWDLGAHDISIFNYWLGESPIAVSAAGICRLSADCEDTVLATLQYPGQILASMHVSWLHPQKVREIVVVGDAQMAVLDDMNLSRPLALYDKGVAPAESEVIADTFGSHRLAIREGAITMPPITGSEPLAAECSHFLECICSRTAPLSDADDGLAVVRVLEAADISLRQGSGFVPVATA